MHAIEPHYKWRNLYIASEDQRSPFFQREYSEFEFTNHVYDHLLHPQWDNFGSTTLFLKVLFAEYEEGFTIIELIGEWNDCLYNDVMTLKRELIDPMVEDGINKFILIGENVLNFHGSDDCYYEEWFDDVEDGWITFLNFQPHVMAEFERENIDQYIVTGGQLDEMPWATTLPLHLFQRVDKLVNHRLEAPLRLN